VRLQGQHPRRALGAPERAIEAWRQALAARPDHQDAFVALERLLGDANRTAELCETLEKHAEVVVEAPQREALIKRVAALYETPLGDLAKAIAAWRSVLDLDQENPEALDALSRLYAATADWQNLVEILQHKIDCTKETQLLRALRFEAAELLDAKLGQLSDAAEHLRRILDVTPDDADALDMLASIFVREKQHAELVDVLDRRARITKARHERDTLAFQAAHVTEHELLDLPEAIARYRHILDGNPEHAEARAALWTLCSRRGQPTARHRCPRTVASPWPGMAAALCEILELRLSVTDVPAERLDVLADIAQVQEAALGDPAATFATWARALADDPSSQDARAALERLAESASNLAGLARGLRRTSQGRVRQRIAALVRQPARRNLRNQAGQARARRGAVARDRDLAGLGRRGAGQAGNAPAQPGQNAGLGRRARARGRGGDRSKVQAEYWAALGELRLGALADRDGAITAFRSALDCAPKQERAIAALRTLALGKSHRWRRSTFSNPWRKSKPIRRAGGLARSASHHRGRCQRQGQSAAADRRDLRNQAGRPARALDLLGRALVAEPGAPETVDHLERVAELAGTPVEAAKRIEAVLDAVEPLLFADMAARAARLHLRAAVATPASEEAALQLYVRVLQAEPENTTALEALDALYRQRGDNQHLAEIIERRGAVELDPSRRMAFYAEAASLHEGSGNLVAAIAAWRAGREGDETNQTAMDELARLYEAAGERDNQVEILREKARMLDDSRQRCAVLMQVAAIKSGPLATWKAPWRPSRKRWMRIPRTCPPWRPWWISKSIGETSRPWKRRCLRQSSVLGGAELIPVLARLAKNAAERLNDSDRALVYLQQILAADPGNHAAFDETAAASHRARTLARAHRTARTQGRRRGPGSATAPPSLATACRWRPSGARSWAPRTARSRPCRRCWPAIRNISRR
jgi:tetratricopeptide (TPR) repeat protein